MYLRVDSTDAGFSDRTMYTAVGSSSFVFHTCFYWLICGGCAGARVRARMHTLAPQYYSCFLVRAGTQVKVQLLKGTVLRTGTHVVNAAT